MASCVHLSFLVIVALFPLLCAGDSCLQPQVHSEVYSTEEISMSTDTVVIVQFKLECKNRPQDLNLYGELNGKILPASKVVGSNDYQVSWSDEHDKIPAGTYTARFFDEDTYADLRKAQRTGDDTSSVKSLFTVDVRHAGASSGQWMQSEFLALAMSIIVFYFAYTTKQQF